MLPQLGKEFEIDRILAISHCYDVNIFLLRSRHHDPFPLGFFRTVGRKALNTPRKPTPNLNEEPLA